MPVLKRPRSAKYGWWNKCSISLSPSLGRLPSHFPSWHKGNIKWTVLFPAPIGCGIAIVPCGCIKRPLTTSNDPLKGRVVGFGVFGYTWRMVLRVWDRLLMTYWYYPTWFYLRERRSKWYSSKKMTKHPTTSHFFEIVLHLFKIYIRPLQPFFSK